MPLKPKDTQPKSNFIAGSYKELIGSVVSVVAFYLVVRFGVRAIDPTAGTTDFGAIDVLAFAFAAIISSLAFVWFVLRIGFKTFHHYLDSKQFRKEFFGEAFGVHSRIYTTLAVVLVLLWLVTEFAGLAAGVK